MRPRASSSAFSACVMISPVDPESLVCVSAVYMYCSWVACLRVRPAPLSLHSALFRSTPVDTLCCLLITLGYLGLKVAKRILAGLWRSHTHTRRARAWRTGTENT